MALTIDLPPGVRSAVERLARESGVTPEQFLAAAAAEKVGVLTNEQDYIAERAARADLQWFDRFMARKSGETPGPEDAAARTKAP
jgi:predicted transcriptional regulator